MSTQARHDGDPNFQKHNPPIQKINRTIAALLKLHVLLKIDKYLILNIDDDVIHMATMHSQNVGPKRPQYYYSQSEIKRLVVLVSVSGT